MGASPPRFTPGELPCKLFSISCPIPEGSQWAWVEGVIRSIWRRPSYWQVPKYTPWKWHKTCKIDLTVGNTGNFLFFPFFCIKSSTEYLIIASLWKIFAATATYPRLQITQIYYMYTCFPFDLWTIANGAVETMREITKCWGNLVTVDNDDSLLHTALHLVILRKARDSIASLLFLCWRRDFKLLNRLLRVGVTCTATCLATAFRCKLQE